MKKLSEVTLEDAKEILSASNRYKMFFLTGRWKLTDETESLNEPSKKLKSERKAYMFWFTDDSIDIDCVEDTIISFDNINYDVKFECYLKAAELGYYVPKLSELINSKNKQNYYEWKNIK